MARNAASNKVMQNELAKKQKAMRRTRTIAHSSHAMRLSKRDCSNSVELRTIQTSRPPRLGIGSFRVRRLITPIRENEASHSQFARRSCEDIFRAATPHELLGVPKYSSPLNFRFFQEVIKRPELRRPSPGLRSGSSPSPGCAATSAGCPNSSGAELPEV